MAKLAELMMMEPVRPAHYATPAEIFMFLRARHEWLQLVLAETEEGARQIGIKAEIAECETAQTHALYAIYKWAIEEKA